jgi:hypothetical protein
MKKPVFGMVLGGVLGVFDGLTALISAPETQSQIMTIVLGSTFKGIIAGLVIGFVATRTRSLAIGVGTGLAVGLFLAYLVTLGEPYFWEIMLPGGIVGVIVGYATMVYGGGAPRARTPA